MRRAPDDAESPSHGTQTFMRSPRKTRPLGALIRAGSGPAERTLKLTGGVCTLGSASSCDIVISDQTVSRQHASLELLPEGVRVKDLGSRNGTFYLGQRVETAILSLGSRIELGAAPVWIEADAGQLAQLPIFDEDTYRSMVGKSPAMRRLFGVLARLEGSLVPVLLEGESGVGKEVVARAIHAGSQVASGPLVIVNCGAFPRELVASELFGHRKGAFTGATENRKGAFESADTGTLFLDELGELPLDVQPMLLRALELGEIRPVGDDKPRQVKVRVVAATNRDLESEVAEGRFREDLFYRVAVVRLRVPPLSERLDDIEPLARHFASLLGAQLPDDVVEQLKTRRWTGNARELRNAVQAYVALGALPSSGRPRPGLDSALADLVDTKRPYADQKDDLVDRFTRIYLKVLLEETGHNQTVAAKMAGLDRTYFGRLLAKHGMSGAGGKITK